MPTISRQNSAPFHCSSCWPVWIPSKSSFFFCKSFSHYFYAFYLMREALSVQSWGTKGYIRVSCQPQAIYPVQDTLPSPSEESREGRSNLEKNPGLRFNPMVERHRNQTVECQSWKRHLEQASLIMSSLLQMGKHKSREGKGLLQCHTAIQCQSWGQSPLPLIPILGLSAHHVRR